MDYSLTTRAQATERTTKKVPVKYFFVEWGLGKIERNAIASSRYDKQTRTRGEKVRRKFYRRMGFFLTEEGSCSYDDERIGYTKVPLKYKNLVKQWIPK